jgi:hypothetical protein
MVSFNFEGCFLMRNQGQFPCTLIDGKDGQAIVPPVGDVQKLPIRQVIASVLFWLVVFKV